MARWRREGDQPSGDTWRRESVSRDSGKKSQVESFFSGAGDAISFGFGDELLGIGGGLIGMDRDDVTNWSRRQQNIARFDNPFSYGGGQLAGALGGGFGAGMGARGLLGAAKMANFGSKAGLATRVGTSALSGAVGGGVYGAGSANDETDPLMAAGEGAMWGGIGGGVLRGAGAPLGHAWREGVVPMFSSAHRAAKMLAGEGERYGQAGAELVKDLKAAPDNAMMVDVQKGGPSLVMGAGARPSRGRVEIREAFDERNNAAGDRASDDLWKSTVGKNKRIDAGQRINTLEDQIEQISYDDIDKQIINLTDPLNKKAVDFITHHRTSANAKFGGAIEDTLEEMRVGDPLTTGLRSVGDAQMDYHFMTQPKFWRSLLTKVREDAQGAMKGAKISGVGKDAARKGLRDYSDLRREVGQMLGPEFESRQAIYRGLKTEQDRLKFGYKAFKEEGDVNVGAFLRKFQKMKPQEQEWVQQGALAAIGDAMDRGATGSGRADVLRRVIGNKSKINTLNAILGRTKKDGSIDQRYGFAQVLKRLDEQDQLFRNTVDSGVGVNSHTTPMAAAAASQIAQTNPMKGAGGIFDAIAKLATSSRADRFDEEVSNHILAAMQRSPKEVLAEIQTFKTATNSWDDAVKEWTEGSGLLARLQKGRIGQPVTLQQRAAALQARQAAFRPKQFQDALFADLYAGALGGVASQ